MKLLFDFFPLALFFIAYKLAGIYTATLVAMAASILQVAIFWCKHHRTEISHVVTLVLILILGTATLLSHNAIFIKWKPTAIYWTLALLCLGSIFIGKKPFMQRLMEGKITLPKKLWSRLSVIWSIFFAIIGTINLYVAYHFSTTAWVNFKVFGVLGSTIVFGILQAVYMSAYLKERIGD